MKTRFSIIVAMVLPLINSCSSNIGKSDAYGSFEAVEVTVSSEVTGRLICFSVEEGQNLRSGTVAGIIDSTDYYLKYEQLLAQKQAIASKNENITAEEAVQKQQKDNLEIDKLRTEKLLADHAAPVKQLDDINAGIRLADRQIIAVQSQKDNVNKDITGIDRQIDQAREALKKCKIKNPVTGTIIAKYMEQGELAVPGKPVYKIANLDSMYLRAYISGSQLSRIKTGDKVEVLADQDETNYIKLTGTVTWISPTAEFTPKIIQTKDERVNLVYAVKVLVLNKGTLKIGMPGELNFIKYSN